jgi:prepilin-type N-terminal cleavage/methylation domain-containing protein
MKKIQFQPIMNRKGVSLIELLIALVIAAIAVAGIFRLFIAQSKAYTVQDQVAEVQQSIRTAMEVLLRDVRMTGFDDDHINSKMAIPTPLVRGDNRVTVSYEYVYDESPKDGCPPSSYSARYTVDYRRNAADPNLLDRQLHIDCDDGSSPADVTDTLLENVENLTFKYGTNNNPVNWLSASAADSKVLEGWKVVAVQIFLQARPTQVNPDLQSVTPRSLASAVTLRNVSTIP